MYDELLKRLRDAAKMSEALAVLLPHSEGNATAKLFNEAADAIEGLICEVADEHNARLDAEERRRWIPVTERLPKDGEWVLVWGRGQQIPTMMFRESGAWIDDQFEFHTTVTHWMPLPQPPKEE